MQISVGTNEVDSFPTSSSSSAPSTPVGMTTPTLGGAQDCTDEPIHIINVSLQYEDLAGRSDADLITKCHKFVQVSAM